MATPDARRTRPQSTVRTPQPPNPHGRAPAIKEVRASAYSALRTPHSALRMVASVSLVLLMLASILTPQAPAAPDPTPFLTPRITGLGAETVGFEGSETERAVFPYLSVVERSTGNIGSTWPGVSDVLTYPPESQRARWAIIGQFFGTTATFKQTLADSGLSANPSADVLSGIESTYQGMVGDLTKQAQGYNGLGEMQMVRSITAPESERMGEERQGLVYFQGAAQTATNTWQYTYNWALANFLSGSYAAAEEGMKAISSAAQQDNVALPPFWRGLAALRLGDPATAIITFQSIIDAGVPSSANPASSSLYRDVIDLSREGLADAYWANRDPARAYNAYLDAIRLGPGDLSAGPYEKWLRLGLQQRNYDGMLKDMATLMSSSDGLNKSARLHHDHARLLSFLGRTDEALSEYRQAIDLGQGDPPLHVSYGEALQSKGDYQGALLEAEQATRQSTGDVSNPNFAIMARAATTTTTTLANLEENQTLFDATILRVRAWSKLNNTAAINALAQNIDQQTTGLSPNETGMVRLYVANIYEAGGQLPTARDSFASAWNTLKGLPPGTPGRAASLIGLARLTALTSSASAGLDVLKSNGYDPVTPKQSVTTDPDAPSILYAGSRLLTQNGQQKEAANAMRVSAIASNVQDVSTLSGSGRPIWGYNGTTVPANAILAAADAARQESQQSNSDFSLATLRYKEAYGLAPALAPAWNNLGVFYAQRGDQSLGEFYLSSAGKVSPGYTLANNNLAALAYKRGIGDFFTGQEAEAATIRAAGPRAVSVSGGLQYDERGVIPSPVQQSGDFLAKLPALAILLLLLLHTLVGADRPAGRGGLIPTRGPLGKAEASVEGPARGALPALFAPRGGIALIITLIVPSILGMLALAWGAGHGSFDAAIAYLPLALVVALVAFGANELAQYLMARYMRSGTLHHNTVLGTLLGIVSIPFGFAYGWQVVTRVQPPSATDAEDEKVEEVPASGARRSVVGRRARTRTGEDLDLLYEAQLEAAADSPDGAVAEAARVPVAAAAVAAPRNRLGLTPAARVIFAGIVANIFLCAVFGLIYYITSWPSMRLALYASALVLAFTSVSEPPADGWPVYRRNPALWLAVFLSSAVLVMFLSLGLI